MSDYIFALFFFYIGMMWREWKRFFALIIKSATKHGFVLDMSILTAMMISDIYSMSSWNTSRIPAASSGLRSNLLFDFDIRTF